MEHTDDIMTSGVFATTVDHCYERLDSWMKLVGWGTFESLMDESTYDFDTEYRERTLSVDDDAVVPDDADNGGAVPVAFAYPTAHPDRALALYVAAMKTVQMLAAQAEIVSSEGEGQDVMATKIVEHAQLTAPTGDGTQHFETIETWQEHHLNLALSRLVRDRPQLLEYGGVTTNADSEASVGPSSDDLVLDINADDDHLDVKTTDDTGTDPNYVGGTAQSQRILDAARDGDTDDSDDHDDTTDE